jgi:hypothetical protein
MLLNNYCIPGFILGTGDTVMMQLLTVFTDLPAQREGTPENKE